MDKENVKSKALKCVIKEGRGYLIKQEPLDQQEIQLVRSANSSDIFMEGNVNEQNSNLLKMVKQEKDGDVEEEYVSADFHYMDYLSNKEHELPDDPENGNISDYNELMEEVIREKDKIIRELQQKVNSQEKRIGQLTKFIVILNNRFLKLRKQIGSS